MRVQQLLQAWDCGLVVPLAAAAQQVELAAAFGPAGPAGPIETPVAYKSADQYPQPGGSALGES